MIKGVFVNSHVRALAKALGDDGLARLEAEVGPPIRYHATEDVHVQREVEIIDAVLRLLAPARPGREDFEAGRLHFRNFTSTPWARFIFGVLPRDIRFMMLHASSVAERVFQGVRFESTAVGPDAVKVVMVNGGYPLDHFRGLFTAWMEHYGQEGTVVAQQVALRRQEFVIRCA